MAEDKTTVAAQNTDNKKNKKPKKQGPIRLEAVLPLVIICSMTYAYFYFFFDTHIKMAVELAGYHTFGAEVNLQKVESSFLNTSIKFKGLQVTNKEQPTHNLFSIDEIRFSMLPDALLRLKFVINEAFVEGISYGEARKKTGKVKPPEPVSNEPSVVAKEAEKLANQGLEAAEEKYSDNVLGDVAALLSGTSGEDQIKVIESELKSQARLKELEAEFKEKQSRWEEELKKLPKPKELEALSGRLSAVKTKDFKSPDEVKKSVAEVQEILNQAQAYLKQAEATSNGVKTDLSVFEKGLKEIESMVKADIKELEARFRLPKIDAQSITRALISQYTAPYMKQFNEYHALAKKYLPPNLLKKKEDKAAQKEDKLIIEPKAREKGVSYEFGRLNAYPFFWVKKMGLSSKASPANPNMGELEGVITDITSSQRQINRTTKMTLKGGFPGLNISGIDVLLELNHLNRPFVQTLKASVASFPVSKKGLLDSSDLSIAFDNSVGRLDFYTQYSEGVLQFNSLNVFNKPNWLVAAKNSEVDALLKNIFNAISMVDMKFTGKGELPRISMDFNSNLGPLVQKGLALEVGKKIEEAKKRIKEQVDALVEKEKLKLEAEVNKVKYQLEQEVKKITAQVDAQKKQADQQIKKAQDQAKSGIENEIRKNLKPEDQKKLDDLKKKFKF